MLHGQARAKTATARFRRHRRQCLLERLEGRVVPSYTFTFNAATNVATALSTGGNNDALVIDQTGGSLQYNLNGTGASTTWGGQVVPNSTATTVDIVEAKGGIGEVVTIGSATAPLSTLSPRFAILNTQTPSSSSLILNDASGTIPAVGTNAYSANNGSFTGPGPFTLTSSVNQTAGVVIDGSPQSDIFNVLGTTAGVPVTFLAGAGTNAVNVGSSANTPTSSVLSTIHSVVNVTGPSDTVTLNIDDAGDSTSASGSLDFLATPNYEVTGLGFASGGKVTFGGGSPGVSNLVVNLGRSGSGGATLDVASTPAGMTTTINGGGNQNTVNFSSAAAAGGLGNLLGPVVVADGPSGLGSINLNDQGNRGNDSYTLTGTMVTRTGSFGGLTYSGLGLGSLVVNAENTLVAGGGSTIDIDSTPAGTMTTVNGGNGVDAIDVNGTDASGTLFVTTGTTGTSTVNVNADLAPLAITTDGATSGPDSVDIGAADGSGTLAGIIGPVTVFGLAPYDLNINDQGDAVARTYRFTINNNADTGSLALSPAGPFLAFRPGDLASLTANGGGLGNTFNLNTTPAGAATNIYGGAGNDAVDVFGTGAGSVLLIDGQEGSNTVALGGAATAPLGLQNFLGTSVSVSDTGGTTALTLDDSQDATARTVNLTNATESGLAPAAILFAAQTSADGSGVVSLAVNGGSGGNTFTVSSTLASSVLPTSESLNSGPGSDSVNVLATTASASLSINGQGGNDRVNVASAGSVADIAGPITIDNISGQTAILVDASADAISHPSIRMQGAASAALTGLAAGSIAYVVADISTLTINTGAQGNQILTEDFSQGNPIPSGQVPGLIFNAGSNATSAPNSHVLNLQGTLPGGAFLSETHNAQDPALGGAVDYGDIRFVTPHNVHLGLNYTGLQPINDTAGAVSFTFNEFGFPDPSFSMVDGSPIQGLNTILLLSTPTPLTPLDFETTTIANKTNVVFNVPSQVGGPADPGVNALVNIPTASTGLSTLTIDTPGAGDNSVAFVELPSAVTTTYNGGGADETTTIRKKGLAAGITLQVVGGPGQNTLTYDAGGLNPVVSAGAQNGEVLIAQPGSGSVDAVGYQQVEIVNVGPLTIVPDVARTFAGVAGLDVADAIAGTFTLPPPPILPTPPGQPSGFPAADFTSSIDWGDPSPDITAGTITQDASNPSRYDITGTHTFTQAGTFTIAQTIAFAGDTITAPVNGETVSVRFAPVAATAGAAATATVTQSPLALTVFPIVGTEGLAIPAAPIATFSVAGDASPAADYSATLSVVDPAGNTTIVPGATITQNGDAAQYTVSAPAFTLPGAGTYQVVVAITDQTAAKPRTVVGEAQAVIAAARLAAGTPLFLNLNTGILISGTTVGTFTDPDPSAAAPEFTATIDWGDGTAPSIATIVADPAASAFDVLGTHVYAQHGTYATTVVVTAAAGSTVSLTGTATVNDSPFTGVPQNFTAVAGRNTGPIVLAAVTDPDPFATAADLAATVNWGDPGGTAGTLSVVLVAGTPAGTLFQVIGSHTYLEEGLYLVTVAVTSKGGATATFTPAGGTADVADALFAPAVGAPVAGVEGKALPAGTVLATFTDSDPNSVASDYSGTIRWGDGSPATPFTSASIATSGTAPDGRSFAVVTTAALTHTYDAEGSYPIGLSIDDAGGSRTTGNTLAVIADAPPVLAAAAGITSSAGAPLGAVALATFTDPDPAAVAGDFAAVIDWGDQTPSSPGTITGGTGGPFLVAGSHTYAKEQSTPYIVSVQVTDNGGLSASTALTAAVSDAPLTGGIGLPIAAVEGQPLQNLPVATFIDTNALGTTTDFTATIAWGDGTTSAGTLAALGISAAGANYQILGSHTYASAGAFAVGVTVTEAGGATTMPTPLSAAAAVADAPLRSSGTSVAGTEGVALTAQVAVFADAGAAGAANDYVASIDWGDWTALTSGTVSLFPADGTSFQATGTHEYEMEGTYQLTVAIRDRIGGATTVASGNATIADAPPVAAETQPVVTTTEGLPFSGAVAAFSANIGTYAKPIIGFTAAINWGDGTQPTQGTLVATASPGVYLVTGLHTYSASGGNIGGSPSVPSGMFPISVLVHDEAGRTLLIANSATVADVAIALAGQLNPASDSGLSATDAITNVTQPNFFGMSQPFSQVSLFAQPTSGGPAVLVGQGEADATGAWIITATSLADGSYAITALAIDQYHETTATTEILPDAIEGPLTIDTAGPTVMAVRFAPKLGQISATFQDGLSGMDQAQVSQAPNYLLSRLGHRRGAFRVHTIAETPSGNAGPDTVVLSIDPSRQLRRGIDTFTILSGAGAAGIRDVAGNPLDGAFSGSFPSGNLDLGADFVAKLDPEHHLILAPGVLTANYHALAVSHAVHDQALARLSEGPPHQAGQAIRYRFPQIR